MYKTLNISKKVVFVLMTAVFALMIKHSVTTYRQYAVSTAAEEKYPQLYVQTLGEFSDSDEKTIYLTYDDGPSANTTRILDVLKEKNVRATFFVIGKEDEASKEIYRRIVNEGHTIGIHTYSHKYDSIYNSVDSYLTDFSKIERLIYETTGQHPKIFRFPGGSINRLVPTKGMQTKIIDEITRRGYIYYDWNIVSGDDTATVYPKEVLAKNVIAGSRKIGRQSPVVLFHDAPICKTTPDATALLIDYFSQNGYTFAPLTEQVKPIQFASGSVKKQNG